MNRIVLTILVLLTAAVALFAAGDQEAPSGAMDTQADPMELWIRGPETMHATYDEAIAEFTERTGLEVEKPIVPPADFENALIRRASGGDLPDIVINDVQFIGTLSEFGIVQEIDRAAFPGQELITDRAWTSAQGADGKYYGIPMSAQAFAILGRSDWRESLGMDVPTTWEEIRELAVAFATQDPDGNGQNDTAGFAFPGSTNRGYASWNFQNIMWSFGGDYIRPTGDGRFEVTVNEAATRDALQWLKDMFYEYEATQPNAINAVTGDINPLFRSGGAGLILTGPYFLPGADESLGRENYEVIPVPDGPDGTPARVLAEGENIYIMNTTDQMENALNFAQFLVSEEGQTIGMTGSVTFVRLPVNRNVSIEAHGNPYWGDFLEIYNNAGFYTPKVPTWFPIRLLMSEYINEALASRDSDIDSILEAAAEALEAELSEQEVLAR